MNTENPLKSIFFINLPPSFVANSSLKLDAGIPLPVQNEFEQTSSENFDIATLSWEMVIAGILMVLAYDEKNQHIEYYRNLVFETKPKIKKELSDTAILKVRNEDFATAEEIFLALRGLDPSDIAIMLNFALFCDQYADFYRKSSFLAEADAYDDLAQSYYKKTLDADTPIPDAFFNAGFFYLKQRNFSRAKDLFETYIALLADLPESAETENLRYKIERASAVIRDISERNLDDELFKTAADNIANGMEEKGLTQIRTFLEKNPTVWNAWFLLGWGLRRLQRWSDAKQAFEQAIDCSDGKNADTYNELAICLMELGELYEAENILFKALQLDPENTKIMSNLGFLNIRMENHSEAKKYFVATLEFDPNDIIAKEAMKNFGYGNS
ncbi:MAG: tetratricopeptide repeat protein [Treponemataceae bacterium]